MVRVHHAVLLLATFLIVRVTLVRFFILVKGLFCLRVEGLVTCMSDSVASCGLLTPWLGSRNWVRAYRIKRFNTVT